MVILRLLRSLVGAFFGSAKKCATRIRISSFWDAFLAPSSDRLRIVPQLSISICTFFVVFSCPLNKLYFETCTLTFFEN